MGRFRRTSSFVGEASSFRHVSSHSGRSHLIPPNSRTGERTGQNSKNITSGLYGDLDLSAMNGAIHATPLHIDLPSGVSYVHKSSPGVESTQQTPAIASALNSA